MILAKQSTNVYDIIVFVHWRSTIKNAKGELKMKKIWNWKLAVWSLLLFLALTLLPACFETTQNLSADGNTLHIGLPFPFYSITFTALHTYAVHCNLASLAADAIIIYVSVFFIQTVTLSVKHNKTKT